MYRQHALEERNSLVHARRALCTRSSCTRVAFYIDDASRCVVPEGACLEHVLALLETRR
jgi:hypothetical protein